MKLTFELAKGEVHEKESFRYIHGKNVLLIGRSSTLNTRIAERLLEKQNMHVMQENGKIGVDLFRASPEGSFDVVLMDIRMPEMSGIEATKKIRALERKDAENIPIIAMSANAYPEDIQKSLKAGMNEHLAKPVDAVVLYKTLSESTPMHVATHTGFDCC